MPHDRREEFAPVEEWFAGLERYPAGPVTVLAARPSGDASPAAAGSDGGGHGGAGLRSPAAASGYDSAPDPVPPFLAGVSLAMLNDHELGYHSPSVDHALGYLRHALGADSVSLMPFAYQPDATAPGMRYLNSSPGSETDAAMIHAPGVAARGLRLEGVLQRLAGRPRWPCGQSSRRRQSRRTGGIPLPAPAGGGGGGGALPAPALNRRSTPDGRNCRSLRFYWNGHSGPPPRSPPRRCAPCSKAPS